MGEAECGLECGPGTCELSGNVCHWKCPQAVPLSCPSALMRLCARQYSTAIFHPLVHFPNVCSSWVSHMGGKGPRHPQGSLPLKTKTKNVQFYENQKIFINKVRLDKGHHKI